MRAGAAYAAALVTVTLLAAPAVPQCSSIKPGRTFAPTVSVGPGSGTTARELEDAAELWKRGCGEDYGRGLPAIEVMTSGNPTYRVHFEQRNAGSACGTFLGRDVTLYAFATLPSGELRHCGDRTQNLAHEYGHLLGLHDAPDTTPCHRHIMSVINHNNTASRAVQREECELVAGRWDRLAGGLVGLPDADGGLDDLAGTDAAGAGPDALRGAVEEGTDLLQVGAERAAGDVVGVADAAPEGGALAAVDALLGHGVLSVRVGVFEWMFFAWV